MKSNLPIIKLSQDELLWLSEVYERNKLGDQFIYKDIWKKLHLKIPSSFHPKNIDGRLINSSGEHIKLLGVVALEGNYEILQKSDKVVDAIKNIMLSISGSTIDLSLISDRIDIDIKEISFILKLIRDLGNFYRGTSYGGDSSCIKTIDLGTDDDIFYNYISYDGIEKLIELKTMADNKLTKEMFSQEEIIILSEKINHLEERFRHLEGGQIIIRAEMISEFNELKEYFGLGKKSWRQLLAGKVFEMVANGIISEDASKEILKSFNPITNLLLD
jgi:hypothetical protein